MDSVTHGYDIVTHTHYISIVCLVASGHGERWERVAPQPSPRRLRHSGKEINYKGPKQATTNQALCKQCNSQ